MEDGRRVQRELTCDGLRAAEAGAAGHPRHAGQAADFLRAGDLEPAEWAALDQGVTVRRGQGCTLRVSAVPAVHRGLPARCRPLDGGRGVQTVPAQRKARREYENRVGGLAPTGP